MSTAFLFPGQGSQTVGMGSELFENFPEELAQANEILGYSISDLCLQDSEDRLGQTQFTQPALYLVSYLHAKSLISQNGLPSMAAGHSVGEFAALATAGAVSFRWFENGRKARRNHVSGKGAAWLQSLAWKSQVLLNLLPMKGLRC